MNCRELDIREIHLLKNCVEGLAAHHNRVSVNHAGLFPRRPAQQTLELFRQGMEQGKSRILGCFEEERVVGFCKIDVEPPNGKLDYLFVEEDWRGKGLGRTLMDWAMDTFRANGARRLEVKVIDGNPAIHLYEKYGFRLSSRILWNLEGEEKESP